LLETLCKLASNFKNFKVRINAALALAAPRSRAVYGEQLPMTWRHLLEALETAQNITDFNEFKHRDTLLVQLCLTLCHVTSLRSRQIWRRRPTSWPRTSRQPRRTSVVCRARCCRNSQRPCWPHATISG